MECLETLVGLHGGCAAVTSDAATYTAPHVQRRELELIVDQNDYSSVDDLFADLRRQAAKELIANVQAAFGGRYLAHTVIDQQTIGDAGTTLTASPALAGGYKGLKLQRYNEFPNVGYRVTRLGFLGQVTGNITFSFVDGLTGQVLGTKVIAAVAGQQVNVNVNALYRVRTLLIVYPATNAGYVTRTGWGSDCCSCVDFCRLNALAQAIPITSTTLPTVTVTNDMGGMSVDVSMECDHQTWLCGIREQMAMPMMWKVCELAMGYGLFNTGRSNTKTVRDNDQLQSRQMMYRDNFTEAMKLALAQVKLPDDPWCFECVRSNRIAVAIP
jgi:hypothetical protein